MCRSHRRCPSARSARARALNTANKRVERARRALGSARAAGNSDTIAAAEAWLQAAQANRAAVDAAHPALHTGGHDTTSTENAPDTPTAAQNDQQATETPVPGRTGGIGTINATGSVTVIDGGSSDTLVHGVGDTGETVVRGVGGIGEIRATGSVTVVDGTTGAVTRHGRPGGPQVRIGEDGAIRIRIGDTTRDDGSAS